jgi:hypothetical protein
MYVEGFEMIRFDFKGPAETAGRVFVARVVVVHHGLGPNGTSASVVWASACKLTGGAKSKIARTAAAPNIPT